MVCLTARSGRLAVALEQLHAPADRVLVAEHAAGEDGVDQTDERGVEAVLLVEEPTAQQAHAHDGEVRRTDNVSIGVRGVGAGAVRRAGSDVEASRPPVSWPGQYLC